MKRDFNQLESHKYDVLVIGGGIYGAWIAYEAALHGLKVALVEKSDWASATSSASSKLIHGGLRYLEHLWIDLVRKSLKERSLLSRLAPHRVHPMRFVIPIFKEQRVGALRLGIAMKFYEWLSGSHPLIGHYHSLTQEKLSQDHPFIQNKGLRGGFVYDDAVTDDARFTLEIVSGAMHAGAICVNYAKATDLIRSGNRIIGAHIQNMLSDKQIELRASCTINASGPWANFLIKPIEHYPLTYIKGIHLVMPPIETQNAFLINSRSDGRFIFLIPWYGLTLLGTTDSYHIEKPEQAKVLTHETNYLLTEANRAFKDIHWTEDDIRGSFCGLRTLPFHKSNTPSSIPRNISIHKPMDGLLMPVGGKFTSARADAAIILSRILKKSCVKSPTQTRPFPWSPSAPFELWKEESVRQGITLGLDPQTAVNAVERYGNTFQEIARSLQENPDLSQRLVPELPFSKAELVHAFKHEMAQNLIDALRRRIPILILRKPNQQCLENIAYFIAKQLDWPDKRTTDELNNLRQFIYDQHITD